MLWARRQGVVDLFTAKAAFQTYRRLYREVTLRTQAQVVELSARPSEIEKSSEKSSEDIAEPVAAL